MMPTITITLQGVHPDDASALDRYLDEECWNWSANSTARQLISGSSVLIDDGGPE